MLTVPTFSPSMKLVMRDEIVGADARRQAEGRRVGNADHLVIVIGHADDGDDGAEGFLEDEFRLVRHEIDRDRRQQRALAAGIVEHLGALLGGLVDAVLEGPRGLLMHHGAEVGRGVHRVAELDGLGLGQHLLDEPVGHALLHEDALHRRAALAGIAGGAGDGEFGRLVEVAVGEIVEDDQRIIAAEFERGALVAGLARDDLADAHAAGEGDDVDVVVGHHLVADVVRPAGDDLEHLGRQACLIENVGKRDGGERRQFGRLADHAIVGGDRRRHLVRHHVERMVERRDGRDDADRLALGEDLARLALRRQIAGEDLAIIENAELARQRIDVIGAAHLVERVLLRQAELQRDEIGELVLP